VPTRSSSLWQAHLAGRVSGTVYTCPADRVVLLKSIELVANTPAAAQLVVSVNWAPDVGAWIVRSDLEAGENIISWSGWVVLESGFMVAIWLSAGEVFSLGSGTLLPAAVR
jgi:hypothetical protein